MIDKNVLILGNNTKHAKVFSCFTKKVFLAIDGTISLDNRLTSEIEEYNILYEKKCNNVIKSFTRIREIKKWVKENDIFLIFVNTKKDLILTKIAFLFKKRKPLILCTFHNSLAWSNVSKVKYMARVIDLCSDGCLCLASPVYKMLVKYINVDKLLFLPNAISTDNFSCKTNYLIKKDSPVNIVYVATIQPNKNQLFAVKVIAKIIEKINVKITFIGDVYKNEYYQEIINFIQKNNLKDNVVFLGSVDNDFIKKNLINYDIYFSTSLKEMSPINILEAKASGLPIIASHAFGQKDLITHNYDGILFEDNSIESAVKALELLITNEGLRKKMGTNAYFYCKESHSVNSYSLKLKEFIKNIWVKKSR